MTVHLVYATHPGSSGPLARGFYALLRAVGLAPFPGSREEPRLEGWPIHAPISITKHLVPALAARGPLKLYDWRETVRIRPRPGDILLGHPHPGGGRRVWNRACLQGGFKACVALVPLHHGLPEICWAMEPYVGRCDRILGIMGPYWWQTWHQGPLSAWQPRIIPVDMAVDIADFPRIKRRFNPPGRRSFLFVGNGQPYKGAHLLSILFSRVQGRHRCVWVGADRPLPYLEPRPSQPMRGPALAALLEECDALLTMGVSDANPTTILEAMAWGLPVACTPQSGYHQMPELLGLSTTDMAHNAAVLDHLQSAPEEELIARADRARKLVKERYGFDRFNATVIGALEGLGAWA